MPTNPRQLIAAGYRLAMRSHDCTGEEKARLLEAARKKYREAENMTPGAGAYNIACTFALEGREEPCREWLDKALEHGILPDGDQLLADMDLDNVRDCDWFGAFLRRAGCRGR